MAKILNLKLCRICLQNIGIVSVFSKYKNVLISELINAFSEIKVEQCGDFPASVCSKCIDNIYRAYIIKKQCDKSDQKIEDTLLFCTMNINNENEKMNLEEFIKFQQIEIKTEPEECHSKIENTFQIKKKEKPVKQYKKKVGNERRKKSFECNNCDKIFNHRGHLRRHIKIHSGKIETEFKCEICQKYFNQLENLKRHLKIHSGQKDFKCNICPAAFIGKSCLIIHKRTHNGEKPFICDICKKGFAKKQACTLHQRTHTKEKPFKCEWCSKSYAYSECLKRHYCPEEKIE